MLRAPSDCYDADVSGVPGLITRFIALPAIRDLPYAMALGMEEDQLAHMPRRDDSVSVLRLDEGRVVTIEFVAGPELLERTLGLE